MKNKINKCIIGRHIYVNYNIAAYLLYLSKFESLENTV